MGGALGVIHTFQCDESVCLDYVPVDYVINGMIAASWKNQFTRFARLQIYSTQTIFAAQHICFGTFSFKLSYLIKTKWHFKLYQKQI